MNESRSMATAGIQSLNCKLAHAASLSRSIKQAIESAHNQLDGAPPSPKDGESPQKDGPTGPFGYVDDILADLETAAESLSELRNRLFS